MAILIALLSIIVFALGAYLLGKLNVKICPICAGVSGTWLWMLAGVWSGRLMAAEYQLIAAMLMGGSAVGIAYQLEKKLPNSASFLLWKVFFITSGFLATYGVIYGIGAYAFAGLGLGALSYFVFLKKHSAKSKDLSPAARELKEKMKNCC